MAKVSIRGLDPADVLAALYNASCPTGMGFLAYQKAAMTGAQARELLDAGYTDFDYLAGRPMKVSICGEDVETRLYDRNLGEGQGEKVIGILRETGDPCCAELLAIHVAKTAEAAAWTKGQLNTSTRTEQVDGIPVMYLGFADVADVLGEAVAQAERFTESALRTLGEVLSCET